MHRRTPPPSPFVRRVFRRVVLVTLCVLVALVGVLILADRIQVWTGLTALSSFLSHLAQILSPLAIVAIAAGATAHLLAAGESKRARTTPISAILVAAIAPATVLLFVASPKIDFLSAGMLIAGSIGIVALLGQIGVWLGTYCFTVSRRSAAGPSPLA
ncbi:MAG TPA: hypothetical protein VKE69_10215 [Planctomycetota bacterium]|nr:hypothetical protein [Planctomycetota bacterium]